MKILTLRFKTSTLRGEWFIDFRREPFASNGLFAITGATGAGKPRCWMPSVWRSITRRRALVACRRAKIS